MSIHKALIERTDLSIKEGMETQFAQAMRERGVPLLMSVPGVQSVSFGRGVENSGKFMLLVQWETMEAHEAYRQTPAAQALRALIGP